MKQHTPPNPHLVRLLIIGAAFLTVTLALILMQPSNSALAELPEIETPYSDTPDDNTVARADTRSRQAFLPASQSLPKQPPQHPPKTTRCAA
jgi:hypothetical protein